MSVAFFSPEARLKLVCLLRDTNPTVDSRYHYDGAE